MIASRNSGTAFTEGTLTGWLLRTPSREGLLTHQRSGCTDRGVASTHMLKDEDLEHFRKRLAAERVVVESRIAARSREVQATVRDEEGVGDRADEATLLYDREQAIDDADLDRETLAQIDRALERIEAGTYGVSEVSGKPIPIDRLEAVPYATTLVDEEALQPER